MFHFVMETLRGINQTADKLMKEFSFFAARFNVSMAKSFNQSFLKAVSLSFP